MRTVVIVNYSASLMSFRGELLRQMASLGHEVTVCAPGNDPALVEELSAIGVRHREIRLERTGLNPLRDLLFLADLAGFFFAWRPDLVLNYTIKPIIYGSLAARLAGVRKIFSVVTGLGYAFIGGSSRALLKLLVSALYKKALSLNEKVFFLNGDDLELFRGNGLVPEGRYLRVHGEGVDAGHYSPAQLPSPPAASSGASGQEAVSTAPGSPGNPPVFLLIARLLADKGIREYVEAAGIVKKRHPEARFQLLGPFDSNPAAIGKEEVARWGKQGVIEYLGERDDVRPFLAAASVYVLPSYREGLPRTVLEAMSMGLPVVTTDAPGCHETVKEGENGFLVPVRDAASLAGAMERFLDDPSLIPKLGMVSRRMVEERFEVRKINEVLLRGMAIAREEEGAIPAPSGAQSATRAASVPEGEGSAF